MPNELGGRHGHRGLRCRECTSVGRPYDDQFTFSATDTTRRGWRGAPGARARRTPRVVSVESNRQRLGRYVSTSRLNPLFCCRDAGRSLVVTRAHLPREAAPPPCAICPAGWPPTSCPLRLLLRHDAVHVPFARVQMLV